MFKALLGKAREIAGRRPIEIGWTLQPNQTSVIWDEPRAYLRKMPRPASPKSVQMCPAAIDFDARNFVVDCPVDMHLRMKMDGEHGPAIVNVPGNAGNVRPNSLGKMLALVSRNEWRHPDRPIVQVITPYLFLTDEDVYISQTGPYLDFTTPAWPGVLIGGRFPIHSWPRHMMWAFEWYDTSADLVLRRGQPWFYVRFEGSDPSRPVRLMEADFTPEVQAFVDSISGVTNYVNRTFSLIERAKKRRPEKLLFPKKTNQAPVTVA